VFRLLTEAEIDRTVVAALVERFELGPSWETFARRYPEATS
jgi:hypothetical protein